MPEARLHQRVGAWRREVQMPQLRRALPGSHLACQLCAGGRAPSAAWRPVATAAEPSAGLVLHRLRGICVQRHRRPFCHGLRDAQHGCGIRRFLEKTIFYITKLQTPPPTPPFRSTRRDALLAKKGRGWGWGLYFLLFIFAFVL